jgi:hypothetical protein
MKLRIYAAVVTLGLIAALTNPSEESHYIKLQSINPWLEGSLLATAKMRYSFADASREQAEQTLWPEWLENSFVSYRDYGLASAVVSCLLWDPCPIGGEKCSLMSVGIFGFVIPWGQSEAVASPDEMTPPVQAKATPSTYVIHHATEEPTDAAREFFAAYRDFQQADKMLNEGRKKEAKEGLAKVLERLEQIKAQDPDWQPMVVDFRLKRTRKHLDALSSVEP